MSTKKLSVIFLVVILSGLGYLGWQSGLFETDTTWVQSDGVVIESSIKRGKGGIATANIEYFYSANDSVYFQSANLGLEKFPPEPGIRLKIEYNSNRPEDSKVLSKLEPKYTFMRRYFGFKGDTTFALSLVNDIVYYEELYLGEPMDYEYFYYDVADGELKLFELFSNVKEDISFYSFEQVDEGSPLGDTLHHGLSNVNMVLFENY
ncbi:MAG: hypothetical protein HWE14_00315 [Flavobacteriia bacterium]|nr:hypothetical protein [Flavobacteriia bacterium]